MPVNDDQKIRNDAVAYAVALGQMASKPISAENLLADAHKIAAFINGGAPASTPSE